MLSRFTFCLIFTITLWMMMMYQSEHRFQAADQWEVTRRSRCGGHRRPRCLRRTPGSRPPRPGCWPAAAVSWPGWEWTNQRPVTQISPNQKQVTLISANRRPALPVGLHPVLDSLVTQPRRHLRNNANWSEHNFGENWPIRGWYSPGRRAPSRPLCPSWPRHCSSDTRHLPGVYQPMRAGSKGKSKGSSLFGFW